MWHNRQKKPDRHKYFAPWSFPFISLGNFNADMRLMKNPAEGCR